MIPKGEEVSTEWYDCNITYTRPLEPDSAYYPEGDPSYDEQLYDAYGNPVEGIPPYDEYDENDLYREYGIPPGEAPMKESGPENRKSDKRPPVESTEPVEIQIRDL